MMVCVTVVGWYRVDDSLSLYKANDTKYRYLKLNANQSLYKALTSVDSLYIKDEKMREHVLATEERNEKAFQLTQRAIQMEKEAKQLKQQVAEEQGKPVTDSTRKAAKVHRRK
jgi:phage anti-repressor protein